MAFNVAEKPSVAKSLAEFLAKDGRPKTIQSSSKFNPVYVTSAKIEGKQVQMLITSVCGHVMELAYPDEQKGSWN